MIQVGASGGTLDFVPMSSSTMTSTYLQQLALAVRPAVMRSKMKLPVLPYHASPALRAAVGNWGIHAFFFCCTISAVSPSGANAARNSTKSM